MIRSFGSFLICSLIMVLFLMTGCKKQIAHAPLRFATCADYPPFEFYTADHKLTGFDIDLAHAVAGEMSRTAVFEVMHFASIFPSLDAGIADVGISTISPTPEREKNVDFSIPYYVDRLAAVFFQDRPVADISDLKSRRLSCQLGTTMEEWLRKRGFSPVTGDDTNQLVEALKAGHTDVVLMDQVQARAFCKGGEKTQGKKLAYVVLATSDSGYCMAFSKGSPLVEKVNQALKSLQKKGVIDALKKRYQNSLSGQTEDGWYLIHTISRIGRGLWVTCGLTLGAVLIGLSLGLAAAIARYQGYGSWSIDGVIAVLRGTPVLLQLSLVYLALPKVLNFQPDIITAGIFTFGVNSAAYTAEIFRGGLSSLSKGQMDASKALKIPSFFMWRDILLPQVMRTVWPSLVNECITLLKEGAIISTFGALDLTKCARIVASTEFSYFLPLSIAGAYYFLLVLLLERLGKFLEKRIFTWSK